MYGAVGNTENSLVNEVVWKCDEASYRVRLIPHLRAPHTHPAARWAAKTRINQASTARSQASRLGFRHLQSYGFLLK
jgi:hypothetical protein